MGIAPVGDRFSRGNALGEAGRTATPGGRWEPYVAGTPGSQAANWHKTRSVCHHCYDCCMQGGGLRQRHKERLRSRVQEQALDLFERNGFEATTVGEIANAAETSPRTVFRYFGTKEDLVFWPSSSLLQLLRDLLAERPKAEARYPAMRAAMCAYAEKVEAGRSAWMRRLRVISHSPNLLRREAEIREEWIAALAEDVATREGAPSVTLEDLAVVLSAFGALSASYAFWRDEKDCESLSDLLDRAFRSIEVEVSTP
jgi:AcrR family transcriptional regulator